jgi:outer membrane receptor protein involved in Fe transport
LQQVPHWTGTASAEYHFNVASHGAFVRADYSYVGSSTSANNDAVNRRQRESYDIVNARAGLSIAAVELSLFMSNLTDEHANLSDLPPLALELPGRARIVTNRPRTIGIEARMQF